MTHTADPEALSDHLEGIRRLVRTLVRDEADVDDVVQDTMVAALESRARVRTGLRAWLAGIARNRARRTARSEGRRAHHEGEALRHGTMPATADVIARAAEQRLVLDMVLQLPEPYRSAVLLRFIEDLPPRKIAKRLDMPVETVRTHVRRGLERVRILFEQAHGGHAGETRAALDLAASEPLGAAHARAVALARASGLVLLLALGAGFWVWSANRETAEDGSVGVHVANQPRVPVAEPPSQDLPSHAPEVPAAGSKAAAPEIASVPDVAQEPGAPPAVDPADVPPAKPEPLVQPIPPPPPTPEPRVAIKDEEPKAKKDAPRPGPPSQPDPQRGSGGPAVEEPEGDGGGGEFYEGETTFSPSEVDRAIDKGISWLTKRQRRDGSWGAITFNSTYQGAQQTSEGMHAGPTALALYALLKCKVSPQHDAVKRGFRYLEKNFYKPPSSYETSMLLLAITARADDTKMLATAKKRGVRRKLSSKYMIWATKLRSHLLRKREARGWRYNVTKGQSAPGGPEDLSSTQLAALALFAAHRLGIRTERSVWEDILSFSMAQQEVDGPEVAYRDPVDPSTTRKARARGFAYLKTSDRAHESEPRGGMTACGLANLEMARFVLTQGGRKRAAWDKRKDAAAVQEAIYDGIAWLDRNWSPFEDPHARQSNIYHVYWLYALERAMDLLGLQLVGGHRWYSEMGQELLNRQRDGHWNTKGHAGGHDILDTCFALLFLKRATMDQIPNTSVTGGSEGPADNR